jgi:nucleoid-associated protein YgaU
VVQKGDTLWSLCSKYFNDPWRWPRLWAANPVITNPHWIFPATSFVWAAEVAPPLPLPVHPRHRLLARG